MPFNIFTICQLAVSRVDQSRSIELRSCSSYGNFAPRRSREGTNFQILWRTRGSAGIGPVRERAITSRNNYRLARPRGPSSRLFLRPGIPTTKNTLPGKRLSRYETARGRSSGQKKGERLLFELKPAQQPSACGSFRGESPRIRIRVGSGKSQAREITTSFVEHAVRSLSKPTDRNLSLKL